VQLLAWPHSPLLQPLKTEPAAGVAVSLTDVPDAKGSLQSLPQLIPAGVDFTAPVPLPDLLMFKPTDCELKVAVQAISVFMVTAPSWQSALPLQPLKIEPDAGVAVSLTRVPTPYA
jgi:hypothetical protein